jgi:hypothetical protein
MTPRATQLLLAVSLAVIALCLSVIVAMEYIVPALADRYYRDDYRKLAYQCDQAMHEEAALRPGTAGAAKDPKLALSADVALMVCHDYDKLRKHLLTLGVSEDRLALHSLEALEVEQIPVSRLVEPHRMGRF